MYASFRYISINLSGSVTGTSESGAERSEANRAMLDYVRLEAERFGSEGAVAEGGSRRTAAAVRSPSRSRPTGQ